MITKSIKLLLIAALCTWPSVAHAQLGSVPYSFSSGTVISSSQINANFSASFANALNRTGGTMTGTLTLSGTAANIILGSNYVSGDGDDEGISIDASGVVTISSLSLTTLTCTGCVGATQIAATAVTAASYGGANSIATFTVDADGRLTAAAGVTPQIPIATGVTGLGTGVATWLATPSSTNLAAAVTDETGSGALVFATSPTFTTPNLGTPSAATLTNATGLPWAGVLKTGSSLADLATRSAADLSSGTLADARLSSNVALLSDNETVTGSWTFSSTIEATGTTNFKGTNTFIGGTGAPAQLALWADGGASGSDIATIRKADGGSVTILQNNGAVTALELDLSGNGTVAGTWTLGGNLLHASSFDVVTGGNTSASFFSTGMAVPSGDYVFLDSGSDTGLREKTANTISVLTGGAERLELSSSGAAFAVPISTTSTLALASGQRQYWDGIGASGNTYTLESAADTLTDVVGGVTTFERTAGAIKVLGTEGGAATLAMWADEGDDSHDKWTWASTAANTLTLDNTGLGTTFATFTNIGPGSSGSITFGYSTSVSGGSTGGFNLTVRNTTNGASSTSNLNVGNDTAADMFSITTNSSTAGTASLTTIKQLAAAGLNIEATNASANIQVIAGGSGGVELLATATAWSAISDERAKTSLAAIDNAAARLATVRTVTGRYTSDPVTMSRSFFIAQDWQRVLPEAVSRRKDGLLSMRYSDTLPLIAAAVNEHTASIQQLERRLTALENRR